MAAVKEARSRQTGGASKRKPLASHFCGVKTSAGAFAPPRVGARTQRTNAGPFSRAPVPGLCFCLFYLLFLLWAI